MATYSTTKTVSASTYQTAADIVLPFDPKRVIVCSMDGADTAYVSFDGKTDAGALINNVLSPSSKQEWRWQFGRKVWLRTTSVAVKVQVIAEQ